MKPRDQQGLARLAATSFAFYAVDMACAVLGFVYGFGLTVNSWWAVLGFMVLSRWVTFVSRGTWEMVQRKKAQPAPPQPSQFRHTELEVALLRLTVAAQAFTDPEGNMPEDTPEFRDLKAAMLGSQALLMVSDSEGGEPV